MSSIKVSIFIIMLQVCWDIESIFKAINIKINLFYSKLQQGNKCTPTTCPINQTCCAFIISPACCPLKFASCCPDLSGLNHLHPPSITIHHPSTIHPPIHHASTTIHH